jgi:hypothetical protein
MHADEPPVLDIIDVAHGHMEGDIALSAAFLVDQEPPFLLPIMPRISGLPSRRKSRSRLSILML